MCRCCCAASDSPPSPLLPPRRCPGAGNTLRWLRDPALQAMADAVVDGVDACKNETGYILAYDPPVHKDIPSVYSFSNSLLLTP